MECPYPKYVLKADVIVPCGNCPACLHNRRTDWISRLFIEYRNSESSSFITLTYAPENVTYRFGKGQLVKRDLQLWFKKVRKAGYKFRYYACGEYGSKTLRPHYHVLTFGDIPENVVRQTWTKGQVHIGRVNIKTVAYCTKYVINSKEISMKKSREPPFSLMSRRPGLGYQYLTPEMTAWHKEDRRNYMIRDGKKQRLPRYYKTKIFSKIDQVRITYKAQNDSFNRLRKELYRLGKYHKNPQAYLEEMQRARLRSIKIKTKQNLTI